MKLQIVILAFIGFSIAQAASIGLVGNGFDSCTAATHSEKGTANVGDRKFVEKGSFNETQRLVVETEFGQGTFATAGFYLMDVSGTKPQYYFLFEIGTNDGDLPAIQMTKNTLIVSGDLVINAPVEMDEKEASQALFAPDILGTFETAVNIKSLVDGELVFDMQDCHSTNKNGGL